MTDLEVFDKLLSLGVSSAEIIEERTGFLVNLVGVSPIYADEVKWNVVFVINENKDTDPSAFFRIVIFPFHKRDSGEIEFHTQDDLENSLMEALNLHRIRNGKSTLL